MLFTFLIGFFLFVCSESVFYDSYSGEIASREEVQYHIRRNTTFWCLNEISPCDPKEGRRIDGSCNNLKHPSTGASHTPVYRLLPAEYDKGFEPRRSKSGKPLPLVRSVRTGVLAEGRVPDERYSILLTHFWVYIVGDFVSVQDTINYIDWTLYCCEEKGKKDRQCIPITVPDDDPVHRFSSIRCMNLTRPFSFQSVGCLKGGKEPERIVSATTTFDLSHFYGTSLEVLNEKGRLFERGMLKYEVENGKIWPPSITETMQNFCILNELPHETRCHDTPEQGANRILGVNLFSVWTWRLHNRIASVLSSMNRCWNDEKLFYTTRDIVIAISIQIYYYELLPALMGYENMVRDGLISTGKGFRDIYDKNILPTMALELSLVNRWAHTLQDGKVFLYDEHGYFLKQNDLLNLTLRTGYLVNNIDYLSQGAIRQASAKYDYIVDPDMAETVLGPALLASDVFSSDLSKNRYFGIAPYIEYRKLCSGKTYKTFDDLLDVIDPERVELLKQKYKYLEDVDLLTGIWLERPIKDGNVPHTFYCIVVKQLRNLAISDRHWYENSNRPNAFTLDQLLEIRNASIAQFMCAVGDSVTKIQPNAFYLPGEGNEMRSCNEIQKINLWKWKDWSCKEKSMDISGYEI